MLTGTGGATYSASPDSCIFKGTMREPRSMKGLEELGRVQSQPRFLHAQLSVFPRSPTSMACPNIPEDPDLAIAAGMQLCKELLEPLQKDLWTPGVFARAIARPQVTKFCGKCPGAWRRRRAITPPITSGTCAIRNGTDGGERPASSFHGSWSVTAKGADWRGLAWWIHDHLPYSHLEFYSKVAAFNIQWREEPARRIDSFISPRGCLTKPGMANHQGYHSRWYEGFPEIVD